MKKRLSIIITVILAVCLAFGITACKKSEEPKESESTTEVETTTAKAQDDYKKIAGIYKTTLQMSETSSIDLFLKIDDKGNFVFARDDKFETEEKGAGKLGKDAQNKDAFIYSIVNGESVKEGERVSLYEVDKDGKIVFTSPMWFGSTEPKITAADGSVTYPVFEKYDPSKEEKETAETTTSKEGKEGSGSSSSGGSERSTERTTERSTEKSTEKQTEKPTEKATEKPTEKATEKPTEKETEKPTEKPTEPPTEKETEPDDGFVEGTYYGSLSKYVDAMDANVNYSISITFSGGNYSYHVSVKVTGGMTHTTSEDYSGTYTIDGNHIYMSGNFSGGTFNSDSVTFSGRLSSFASSEETVSVYR